MIRKLRSRHRGMILVVGAATAILLVASLGARREVPTVEPLRVDLRGELQFARPGDAVASGYSVSEAKAAYEHLSSYHKKKGWDQSGWWARKG